MWFTRVSIANPVFATMVMAALCVLGLFSYSQLRVERLPDITPPIVFIVVAYPGASPEAVETELTRPLELSLNGIAGVKMIRSNSLEGRSETVVEFQVSADMNRAVQDVRDKVAVDSTSDSRLRSSRSACARSNSRRATSRRRCSAPTPTCRWACSAARRKTRSSASRAR